MRPMSAVRNILDRLTPHLQKCMILTLLCFDEQTLFALTHEGRGTA